MSAIHTKDLSHWQVDKVEAGLRNGRGSKKRRKQQMEDTDLRTRTFTELNGVDKDNLLKGIALRLGMIRPD